MSASASATLLRVEKGKAAPEELAAITAILLARAAATTEGAAPERGNGRSKAAWRRVDRASGFLAPHSWQG